MQGATRIFPEHNCNHTAKNIPGDFSGFSNNGFIHLDNLNTTTVARHQKICLECSPLAVARTLNITCTYQNRAWCEIIYLVMARLTDSTPTLFTSTTPYHTVKDLWNFTCFYRKGYQ